MGDPQRGDDALYFFAANLGRTERLACSGVAIQRPDNLLALEPGRYLLHIADLQTPNTRVWVTTGKFEKGSTVSVVADVPHFPMHAEGIVAIEINVRKGDNDQIAAITGGATATLFITQISRAL